MYRKSPTSQAIPITPPSNSRSNTWFPLAFSMEVDENGELQIEQRKHNTSVTYAELPPSPTVLAKKLSDTVITTTTTAEKENENEIVIDGVKALADDDDDVDKDDDDNDEIKENSSTVDEIPLTSKTIDDTSLPSEDSKECPDSPPKQKPTPPAPPPPLSSLSSSATKKNYELSAVVCEINDGTQRNFVSLIYVSNSYHKLKLGDRDRNNGGQWYLFNDFCITPVSFQEAVWFTLDWKVPCVLYYTSTEITKRENEVTLNQFMNPFVHVIEINLN